jgi:uncharacterized damage-inducible protein DinB
MTIPFRDSIFHQILADDLAKLGDPAAELAPHFATSQTFLEFLPEAKAHHAYAPGKWTVSQVIGHLLDTRAVFLSRLLYIARGESIPLPGFDEQLWVRTAAHDTLDLPALRALWKAGADLLTLTVRSLPAPSLDNSGNANGITITVREILLYLIAHEKHHLRILSERYLTP